jgi:hypothetical protein
MGGYGANDWASVTTLPAQAGAVSTAGNAGLVILTYMAQSCTL